MIPLALLTVLSVSLVVQAQFQYQMCLNGGSGPCLFGTCPNGQTCILTGPGEQVCCPNAQIISPGLTTTTIATTSTAATTTAAACRDLLNPRTGVSDCPNVAYLCNNSVYYNLMTQQCPRTCGRCPGTSATGTGQATVAPYSTTCRDLVNPTTGTSNCGQMYSYCQNPIYRTLMRQQCPLTCGYCV
ncbi:hypothetical protein V3C99_016781 [Haemonchus contortus]|uniref:ShTK domain protein n=1 Tax=Haemonchus contortus TaxID=6289 RepID=A0A7I5EDM4_HAECO